MSFEPHDHLRHILLGADYLFSSPGVAAASFPTGRSPRALYAS